MSIFAAQYLVGPGVFLDVTDTAAFRTHLGLGSAALQASTAFALLSHTQPFTTIGTGTASGVGFGISAGNSTSSAAVLNIQGGTVGKAIETFDENNTSRFSVSTYGITNVRSLKTNVSSPNIPIDVNGNSTACTSLNADLLDGSHAAAFAAASHTHAPTAIAGATTTGQLLISLTDGTFTAARLTAGSGVTLTHGSGSITLSAGGGATSATALFPAHSFFLAGTNSAGLISIGDGTTARVCLAFDDTTETYGHNIVTVPSNLNASGTVSFSVFGGLRSATTGNLLWTFGERESADSESWTGAYAEYDSASTAISGATTTQRAITWSVAVATLGWAAGDVIRFRVSRDPSVSGDATGDSLLDLFSITFPTA